MTEDELFETVAKIIGNRPKTGVINNYDKIRAVQVFLGFDEFLIEHLPGYCEGKFEFDFGDYTKRNMRNL